MIPITVVVSLLYRETHLHLSCQNIVEKSDKENLKVIKNTLANESGTSWKPKKIIIVLRKVFNKCAYNWWGLANGVLLVILCTVLWSMKKHCAAKIFQGIWEKFLCENNNDCNSYKFSYKFPIIFFLSFRRNQKQESNFQQVGELL